VAFNAMGFAVASAMTRDMPDRQRAAEVSVLSGMLGNNLVGAVLLATTVAQSASTTSTTGTSTTGTATTGSPASSAPAPTGTAGLPAPTVATLVQVPMIEDPVERAEQVVSGRGLVPVVEQVESDEPMGAVMGSDPTAETVVARGSTVNILVSAGIEVPDVTGKQRDDAVELIELAGFELDQRAADAERTGTAGYVERQDPQAHTYASAGSPVTIYVFGSEKLGAVKSVYSREFEDG
jgi:hypothetical protein